MARCPSLGGATAWLNSPPLTAAGLRGKVVLVEFWTYTCINWLRSLPYVRAWAEKYRAPGPGGDRRALARVPVRAGHRQRAPGREELRSRLSGRDRQRLRRSGARSTTTTGRPSTSSMRRGASDIAIRRGRLRGVGDGHPAAADRGRSRRPAGELVSVERAAWKLAADWDSLKSPENYVGYERTENFASPGGAALGRASRLRRSRAVELNQWALSGDWTMGEEAAVLNGPSGRIAYRFHARDLHLVMGPSARGRPCAFACCSTARRRAPRTRSDVDEQGDGTVTEPAAVPTDPTAGAHRRPTVRDRVLDPGVEASRSHSADPEGDRAMSRRIDIHRRRFLGTAAMTLAAAPLGLLGMPRTPGSPQCPRRLVLSSRSTRGC